jgi:5-deoxy-glucuronate isomerase
VFGFLKLGAGESYSAESGERELLAVLLGGKASLEVGEKRFEKVGGRPNVFNGKPHSVYIPAQSKFTISAESAVKICTVERAERPGSRIVYD